VIERLAAIRNRIDDAVGPLGPSEADVAARGRRPRRTVKRTELGSAPSRPSRYRDGDWRRTS
jgi:hypothetical protein